MKNRFLRVSAMLFATVATALSAVAQDQSRKLPEDQPRMGDGFIHLKGMIQEASTNTDTVTFRFTGHLHFSFFTAAYGDSTRKRVDMDFDMKKAPISVPRFGKAEYDAKSDPFIVSFRNVAQHAWEATQSGEPMSIALFRPRISYDSGGMIGEISCDGAQVLADRLVKQLRGDRKP